METILHCIWAEIFPAKLQNNHKWHGSSEWLVALAWLLECLLLGFSLSEYGPTSGGAAALDLVAVLGNIHSTKMYLDIQLNGDDSQQHEWPGEATESWTGTKKHCIIPALLSHRQEDYYLKYQTSRNYMTRPWPNQWKVLKELMNKRMKSM